MLNRIVLIGPDHTKPKLRRPQLNSGRKISKKGYVQIYRPDHPFAGKDGYIFEHRLVMEEKLGRYLQPEERVHHLNEIKDDNSPDNLEIKTNGAHTIYHHTGAKRSAETKAKISQRAKQRFANKRNHPEYRAIEPEEFKEVFQRFRSVKAVCIHFRFTKKTFYNKLDEMNLRGWYASA